MSGKKNDHTILTTLYNINSSIHYIDNYTQILMHTINPHTLRNHYYKVYIKHIDIQNISRRWYWNIKFKCTVSCITMGVHTNNKCGTPVSQKLNIFGFSNLNL